MIHDSDVNDDADDDVWDVYKSIVSSDGIFGDDSCDGDHVTLYNLKIIWAILRLKHRDSDGEGRENLYNDFRTCANHISCNPPVGPIVFARPAQARSNRHPTLPEKETLGWLARELETSAVFE